MNNYNEQIAKCCKLLRLSSNIAAKSLTISAESNQEYLYKILQSEVDCRENSRTDRMMTAAAFPKRYDFTQFDDSETQYPSDTNLDDLKGLNFHKDGKNLIMYGNTGTGKTMLSICLGIEACKKGIPVKFFRTASLINQLSEAKTNGVLTTYLKKLNKASILILDELGYVPYDRTGSQLFFDFLSEIHEKKTIILNINLEFSRWANVFYDEQMTVAMIGRLTHRCHLLLFPGKNNRLIESSLNTSNKGFKKEKNKDNV